MKFEWLGKDDGTDKVIVRMDERYYDTLWYLANKLDPAQYNTMTHPDIEPVFELIEKLARQEGRGVRVTHTYTVEVINGQD